VVPEGPPKRLPGRREGGLYDLLERGRLDTARRRGVSQGELDHGGCDLWRGEKGAWWHLDDDPSGGPRLTVDTEGTSLSISGGGDHPSGHLLLEHHDELTDPARVAQETGNERGPHVVWQVRDAGPAEAREDLGPVHGHCILLEQREAGAIAEPLPEKLRQVPVKLDSQDLTARIEEALGEPTKPGSDLDDPVPWTDARRVHDPSEDALAGEEVLTEALARMTMLELPKEVRGMVHQVPGAQAARAVVERGSVRPASKAMRPA